MVHLAEFGSFGDVTRARIEVRGNRPVVLGSVYRVSVIRKPDESFRILLNAADNIRVGFVQVGLD